MASANNLYIKRTDFTSMTKDMTFENVNGFYYEGSFYKDFKELYIDGNDLVVITNINNYKTIFKNYVKKPFKLIRAEDEGLIDLIDTGLIQNNEPITEPQRGNTVKGTIYSDNIYLTGYEAPKNIKKLNVSTDKGNDTIIAENLDIALVINAGNGDDIVKVSGGENTISGGKGADEFVFEMGNSTLSVIKDASEEDKIKIVGDISINDLIFAKGGNNLILIYKNGNVEDRITINGYFKSKNKIDDIYVAGKLYSIENLLSFGYWISGKGGISGTKEDDIIIGSLFNDSINAGAGDDIIYANGGNNKINAGAGDDTIYSGSGNDTINAGAGDDDIYANAGNNKINAGAGDDTIHSGSGNDIITGGAGSNTIIYSAETFGNDTIYLTKGENLVITGLSGELLYSQAKNKADLLVTNEYGTITLKNYYSKNTGANVLINGINLQETVKLDQITASYFYDKIQNKYIQKKYTGSALAENIDVSGLKYAVNEKTNAGLTINASFGNDIIKGSKFNDTITGGAGSNIIIYSAETFGNDIIHLTKGENLVITGLEGITTYSQGKSKSDLLITNEYGTITLKNYYSKDLGAKVLIDDVNLVETVKLNQVTATYFYDFVKNKYIQKTYTGSVLADNIDASDLKYAVNEKTNAGVTINTGLGNDIIKGSKFNDTITGGAGSNTIIYSTETFGNDTITVTKGEKLTIDLSDYGFIKAEDLKDFIFETRKGFEIAPKYKGERKGIIFLQKYTNMQDVLIKLGNDNIITLNDLSAIVPYYGFDVNGVYEGTSQADEVNVSLDKDLTINTYGGNDSITVLNNAYKTVINAGTGNDVINISGTTTTEITPGSGNDTIKTGSGISNIYLTSGGGNDTLINSGGTDTIYFNKNTKYYISYNSDGQTVLNYNSGKDSITIGSYNSETYLKIGNNDAEKVDTSKKFLLGADSTETVTLDGNGKVNLLVVNKYTNKTLTYSLENLSSSQRKFTFTTLENGRLLIKGDYLKMIAEQGQSDDIILMGNNNYVDTSDCNDIVRAGYTVDNLISSYNYKYYDWTSKETYNKSVSNNTIITGDGNDHIILYGNNNKINAGAGSDTMLLKSAGQGNQYTNIDEYYIQWETLIENSQNGKIGLFGQEGRGDCRLFSLLYSLQQHYDMTSDVNDSIRDLVLINEVESGVYNVEFSNYNGPGDKSCEINVNEVYANYGSYKPCSGDIDVFLIDEAMNQLIEKNDESEGYTQVDTVEEADYNTITQYLFGTNKAGFYETKTDLNELANKYFSNDISNLTIGISEMNYMDYYIYEYYYDYLLDYDLEADSNYMSLEKYFAQYKDEIDNYKNSHINNDQLGYITGHAYALKEFNNNCMVLVNPWDSGDCITIDLKGFDSELYDKERNLYISVITYDWGDEKQITNGGEWNKFEKTEDIYIENIAYQTAEWLSSGSVEVSLVDIDNNQISNIDMQLYTVI